MTPDWYLTQAQDYISVLQNINMYTYDEVSEITKKQRQFEYQLMRVNNGLPRIPVPEKHIRIDNPRLPAQTNLSYRQLMSKGYSPIFSQKSKSKVKSYA